MNVVAALVPAAIAVVLSTISIPTAVGQKHHRSPSVSYPSREWVQANPSASGWSIPKLDAAHAFFRSMPPASIVIVDRGKVVAMWGDPSRRIKVSSMRKSFLSALFGIAASEKNLNLDANLSQVGIDDVPPLTEVEKQATVRMLLEARSGVYHSYVAGTPAMRAAMPQRGAHAPGSFWSYNNWDFNALGAIFESQTHQKIGEAFHLQIAVPLQMQDFTTADMYYLRADQHAHEYEQSVFPAYHFRVSARDLARFGYLYLQHGRWKQKQVVPAAWVEESTRAHSDAGEGRGYGYLWWTNYLPLPVANIDAVGAMAKYLFIFPERQMVIAYLNYAEFPDTAAMMTEAELNALPAASPAQMTTLLTLLLKAQTSTSHQSF